MLGSVHKARKRFHANQTVPLSLLWMRRSKHSHKSAIDGSRQKNTTQCKAANSAEKEQDGADKLAISPEVVVRSLTVCKSVKP